MRADALMDLAEVLRLSGEPAQAMTTVRQALNLCQQKCDIASEGKARKLLEEVISKASGGSG